MDDDAGFEDVEGEEEKDRREVVRSRIRVARVWNLKKASRGKAVQHGRTRLGLRRRRLTYQEMYRC